MLSGVAKCFAVAEKNCVIEFAVSTHYDTFMNIRSEYALSREFHAVRSATKDLLSKGTLRIVKDRVTRGTSMLLRPSRTAELLEYQSISMLWRNLLPCLGLVALLGLSTEAVMSRCPTRTPVEDFDMSCFRRTWYEVMRTRGIFDFSGRCVRIIYTKQESNRQPLIAKKTYISKYGTEETFTGNIVQVDRDADTGIISGSYDLKSPCK
ncbi:uncharacterized protein LOC143028014 [Oratosquilla oratoria]|uniref:uncharacterized protein LOC143028014 n=1 Tax=Oratosquilla oratoria TaxID=337810 RepID=UPI003F75C47B